MSPKVLTNILVLSTMAKDEDSNKKGGALDIWDAVEPTLTMKIRDMDLEDLLNLMWSSIEIEKGSGAFSRELENEISKRILKVKDEEFQTLLACFTSDKFENSQLGFSDKFLEIVIKVIHEKKDRF